MNASDVIKAMKNFQWDNLGHDNIKLFEKISLSYSDLKRLNRQSWKLTHNLSVQNMDEVLKKVEHIFKYR